MDNHTDGFYEIEFQRMYREQGRVLYRIRHFEKQLNCYINKKAELAAHGIVSPKLADRINLVQVRLNKVYTLRDEIEAYKEEISVNNPANAERAAESKIISDAYERAYAPVVVESSDNNSIWNRFFGFIFERSR